MDSLMQKDSAITTASALRSTSQSRDLGVLDGTYQAAAAVSLKQLAATLDSSNPFIPALSNCMDDSLLKQEST